MSAYTFIPFATKPFMISSYVCCHVFPLYKVLSVGDDHGPKIKFTRTHGVHVAPTIEVSVPWFIAPVVGLMGCPMSIPISPCEKPVIERKKEKIKIKGAERRFIKQT